MTALDDDLPETKKRSRKAIVDDADDFETETDRLLSELERKMQADQETLSEFVDSLEDEEAFDQDEDADDEEIDEEDEDYEEETEDDLDADDEEEEDFDDEDLPPSLAIRSDPRDSFFEGRDKRMDDSKLGRFMDKNKENHKAIGMIIGILIGVLIAIALVVYLAIKLSDSSTSSAVAIKKDTTPAKVRPEQPGGMDIPGMDRSVYERLAPMGGKEGQGTTIVSPERPVRPVKQDPIGTLVERTAGTDSTQNGPTFSSDNDHAPIYTPRALRDAAATAKTPTRMSIAAPSQGAWKVQLVAVKSDAAAKKSWAEIVKRVPALKSYTPEVMRVDLPDKGTIYRLRAAGFGTKSEANDFCEAYKRQGGSCFVVK